MLAVVGGQAHRLPWHAYSSITAMMRDEAERRERVAAVAGLPPAVAEKHCLQVLRIDREVRTAGTILWRRCVRWVPHTNQTKHGHELLVHAELLCTHGLPPNDLAPRVAVHDVPHGARGLSTATFFCAIAREAGRLDLPPIPSDASAAAPAQVIRSLSLSLSAREAPSATRRNSPRRAALV